MKKNYFLKGFLGIFLLLFFVAGKAQAAGDYRAIASGDWGTQAIWEVYKGGSWGAANKIPGVVVDTNAKYKVTITAGHTVNIPANYAPNFLYFGDLVIEGTTSTVSTETGQLILNKSMLFNNTMNVIIDKGILNLNAQLDLKFPANAQIYILGLDGECSNNSSTGINGLGIIGGSCNNNVKIYIGPIIYATCTGKGSPKPAAGTFCDMNMAGGTLKSLPTGITLNYCGTLPRSTPFKLEQTSTANQGVTGLEYQWSLESGPTGYNFTTTSYSTSSVLYVNPSIAGVYIYLLKVRKTISIGSAIYYLEAKGEVTLNLNVNVETGNINSILRCSQYNSGNVLTLTAAEPTATVLKWQSSPVSDFSSGVVDIAHTGLSYTLPNNISTDMFYRVVLTNSTCAFLSPVASVPIVYTYYDGLWSDGLPGADKRVIFLSPYNITGDFPACSIVVQNNAAVTVSGNLISTGEVIVESGSLTVQTDANLIQTRPATEITNSGNIKVQRYLTGLNNNLSTGMDYVYWSSPVVNQLLRGSTGFSPNTASNRFYQYNEANDFFYSTPDVYFKPAKGYAIRAEEGAGFPNPYSKTYEFTGVPQNGYYDIDITRSADTGAVVHGFNLVGNPYPSNIDFDVLYNNNSSVIWRTAYFWTNNIYQKYMNGSSYSGNNYAVYNPAVGGNPATAATHGAGGPGLTTAPTKTVKVGQAFIIQKKDFGTQKLIFQNKFGASNLRITDPGTFFYKGEVQKDRFWLKLISPDNIVNTQLIAYIPGATNNFEKDFDAEAFDMTSDLFYSKADNKVLLIQGKGDFTDTDKVILGANFFKKGNYTIELENNEGIFANTQDIYLKDNVTHTCTNLKNSSYTFAAEKGISEGRFEIVYQPQTVIPKGVEVSDELAVYREAGSFVVKAQSSKITGIEVYDTGGRLVYQSQPQTLQVQINTDQLNNGLYILKINQNGKISDRKMMK